MRWIPLLVLGAPLIAGCKKDGASAPKPAAEVASVASRDSSAGAVDRRPSESSSEGTPSGAPVQQGQPNVPEFQPAFPNQTRAPAIQTKTPLEVKAITDELKLPWAIAFLPDGRMLITEKHDGELHVVTQEGKISPPVVGVPKVDAGGQGGLLDVALDPEYQKNHLIYLSYYEPREGGNGLTVARGKLELTEPARLGSVNVIFRMLPTVESDKHAGGRLVFAEGGMLFVTLGERSIMKGRVQARDLDSHLGKIVRIEHDGSIPESNPFVEEKGALGAIWTRGHRNVLGADLDEEGRLWVAEMGPQGGDELNLVKKGADYGWPKVGYGEEYSGKPIHERPRAPDIEEPVYYWDPVISPGALLVYSGDLFAGWQGDILLAGLSSRALVRLEMKDDRVVGEERLLQGQDERMREVVQGPDGALWLLTDSGKLLKVTPRGD